MCQHSDGTTSLVRRLRDPTVPIPLFPNGPRSVVKEPFGINFKDTLTPA